MASPSYQSSRHTPRRVDDNKIELELGVPQVFALKQPQNGREVGEFGSVMYTAVDDRKLFVVRDEASDFHHAMVDLRIQPAEFIRCTRVKHGGRGGGFSIRVERAEDDPDGQDETKLEQDLKRSLEMQRARIASAPAAAKVAAEERKAAPDPRQDKASTNATDQRTNGTAGIAPAPGKPSMGKLLAGALIASVDAYLLAAEYARSKGVAVELKLVFNGEDVRASANSMFIEYWKKAGRA